MADTIDATVQWSGEHWINYLRRPGETADSGGLSLYHTHYSQAGAGTVACIDIPAAGWTAICTDNRELAAWLVATMIRGRGNQFDRDLPLVEAAISRGGDIRTAPSWTVQAAGHTVVSTWHITEPATIHWGPAPSGASDLHIFSLLFFTDRALLNHNSAPVEGVPYTRDIWRNSIGGDRSSCVFALAETFLLPG
ncbi:MAG: hypothetical protein GKR89_30410 [Candidatus Latescibacteria bacterium]|nr:hypothetical protein [Candidatus Latescibacterota bacterium]